MVSEALHSDVLHCGTALHSALHSDALYSALHSALHSDALYRGTLSAAGVPDDVFLHNVTEHVDYRGNEYDLTGQVKGYLRAARPAQQRAAATALGLSSNARL